jgi:hypothetical protein
MAARCIFILLFLESRVIDRDANGVINTRTCEFGISWLAFLKAPQSSGAVKHRRITVLIRNGILPAKA